MSLLLAVTHPIISGGDSLCLNLLINKSKDCTNPTNHEASNSNPTVNRITGVIFNFKKKPAYMSVEIHSLFKTCKTALGLPPFGLNTCQKLMYTPISMEVLETVGTVISLL